MFIYKITNIVNGKIYIGLTKQKVMTRFKQHIYEANKEGTGYLHRAIKKYSPYNFVIEQIDSASSVNELELKEKYYIKFYNSNNRIVGYNLAIGGYSNIGYKHTEETKKLQSIKASKRVLSDLGRESLRKSRKEDQKRHVILKELAERRGKQVIELDLNNNILNTYKSISECARILDLNRVKVRSFLRKNNNKLYCGKYNLKFK